MSIYCYQNNANGALQKPPGMWLKSGLPVYCERLIGILYLNKSNKNEINGNTGLMDQAKVIQVCTLQFSVVMCAKTRKFTHIYT